MNIPKNIIHEAIIGSRLKGNDTPKSDMDTIGIFIAPNEEIGGFDWNDSRNIVTDASPQGDDHTYYEVRKFFRLAAKSTPAILPFLSSHIVIGSSSVGSDALRVAQGLISEKWLRKNANYVKGKYESYLSTGKEKELIEAYYIGELTGRWLREGKAPWATLGYFSYLSSFDFGEFMYVELEEKKSVLDFLAMRIETIPAHSLLPSDAKMEEEATEFLKHVRNNIG